MFGGKVANYGGAVFGPNDFTTALTYSINTTFGKVGNLLGRKRLVASMQRFGFYQSPPLPLPQGEVVPSGRYGKNGLSPAGRVHGPAGGGLGGLSARSRSCRRRCRWLWSPRAWPTAAAS